LRNAPPHPPIAAVPTRPAPVQESADPASFISGDDLPEWIRQIAAADAVKQAESERDAANAAAAVAAQAARRIPLPGETGAVSVASPWLARRESAAGAHAWGGAAPATPAPEESIAAVAPGTAELEMPEVVRVDPDELPPAATKRFKLGKPSVSAPSLPKMSAPKLNLPTSIEPTASPKTRYALYAGIVFLVIVLIAMLVL
jgi:hypothetical protein